MKRILQKVSGLFLFFILVSVSSSLAQLDPWNAKIMFHSLNGYVDTLWIGCDEFGAAGYQPGLDIVDTTFVSPGGIWGYDPIIPSSECFNLKKDIKNFVSGFQTFNIKMADSLPDFGTQYDYISIDTNDFKFDNGQYKITSIFIESISGYVIDIDVTSVYLYAGFDTSYLPEFYYDQVKLIFETGSFDCLPTNDEQMEINIEIGFNYYIGGTSIETVLQPKVSLYPNPAKSDFYISSEKAFNKITLYDHLGRNVYSSDLLLGRKEYNVDIENLVSGIYQVLLSESKEVKKYTSTKLIVQ